MNALLVTAALTVGQPIPDVPAPPSTALDGVWTVVAMEISGRPATLTDGDRALAIRNNTLTLPGVAALHGTIRIDLGRQGTLRAIPAATGTGARGDPTQATGVNVAGTSGTGVVGGANGVYVRTADYLVLTIGDPSAATATGTGVGPTTDPGPGTGGTRTTPGAGSGTLGTVGQPPVSLVLRRSTGADAPPSTAATPPRPTTPTPTAPPTQTQPAAAQGSRRLTSVVGSNVTLGDGSTAGRIADVVYGPGGAIDYVALDNNGVFTAVPWGALNWDAARGTTTLPLTRDQFGTISTFGANDWSKVLTNANFSQQLQTTFGNFRGANGQPLFTQLGNSAPNMTGNRAGGPPGGQPGGLPGGQPGVPPGGLPKGQPKTPPRGAGGTGGGGTGGGGG